MQQYTEPATAKVADDDNLTAAPWANADAHGSDVAYRRLVDDQWQDVTFSTFRDEVATAAKGFLAAGLQPGDRVGLISPTRYEWTLLDYALWAAGAVTLPIYETSSSDQVEWCLSDSGAKGVIVESDEHRAIVENLRDKLPELEHVWQIDGADGAVSALRDAGAGVDDATLEERRTSVHADDLATLIYTSGTTGRPKGCEITHRNLLVRGARRRRHVLGPHGARELDAAVPPARAHLRPRHPVRRDGVPLHDRPLRRHEEAHHRAAPLPARLPALGAARVREGLQRRQGQGAQRRQGPDLRHGRGDGRLLQRVPRRGRPRRRPAPAARPVRQARVRQAPGRARREVHGRGLRRLGARRAHRPLLPRHRRPDPRGLRAHRDQRGDHRQPEPGDQGRHRRQGHPRHHDRHRRGRRDPRQGRRRVPRLLEQRGGDGRGDRRRLVPHRRPRQPRRGRLPLDHRPQEGAHRHRGRQERRPRGARGPRARPPPRQPGPRRRRQPALHRGADHPRPRGPAGLELRARQGRLRRRRPSPRTPTCSPRSPARSTTPTAPSPRPRRSSSGASSRATSPRRAASSPRR